MFGWSGYRKMDIREEMGFFRKVKRACYSF